MHDYDIVIIGGGAAGLMCAAAAGGRGRRVLVLEGSNKVGKKILMSGGGRCNFTNLNSTPANFLSANPQFCISALRRYTPEDFVELVERHGIPYHEKAPGQLFCDRSSKDILAMLRAECDAADVRIITRAAVTSVSSKRPYRVECALGSVTADSLVIATGGLSIPKMGASGFGYELAAQFGLNVLETRAGLVPFVFSDALRELCSRLAGVSLPVSLGTDGADFTDDLLFTHRGLSGPAALQLSSYWQPGHEIRIDLLPDHDLAVELPSLKARQPRALLRSILSAWLPRALVLELEEQIWSDLAQQPLAAFRDRRLCELAGSLGNWRLKPSGTEGYRTAEVTLGGIDTRELSSKTLEVRRQPGLFCIGEVVDVTGHLGGHNFQWAWASAQAAATAA